MFKKKYKISLAFTLAEVLITLGVIGIVAAMTIPVLLKNNAKVQHVIGLKKAYTAFNQALKQMTADYGCIDDLKCTGLFASAKSSDDLGKALVRYFKVVKNCGTSTTDNCWPEYTNDNYDGSGPDAHINMVPSYKFVTADGMSFSIDNVRTDCGGGMWLTQLCGQVLVDVNGPKKPPNQQGRDTFFFYIYNDKGALLFPCGGPKSSTDWKDASGNIRHCYPGDATGAYCAGRIMDEGWQMNY